MANRSDNFLLRLTGCCFALAFACTFSLPASADTISHSGTFFDDGSIPNSATDDFTITNTSPDSYDITILVIDFSTVVWWFGSGRRVDRDGSIGWGAGERVDCV